MELLHRTARRKYPWEVPKEWGGLVHILGEYRPKLHHLLVKWEKPTHGKIKCNTDGVSRGNPWESAYNFCLRNDRGILIYAQAEPMGNATNMQPEIRAIKEAVTNCKAHEIREVIIESDSLITTKMIKAEWKIPWYMEDEIQHIQHIMQEGGT